MTTRPYSLAGVHPGATPVPGPHSLLVDSGEFYAAIAPAILAARRRVYIQVMTFELDRVGARLWELLARSPAACKILCVDAFSRVKISDRPAFGWRYWTSASFRAETRRTRRLLRPGIRDGVRIVITNPLGAFWHKYPHRNHKKMMIVDDAAFLGGINFSDHNFAWHDLMLRTTDPTLVSALAADFHITIAGRNQNAIHPTPGDARPTATSRSQDVALQTPDDARLYLLNGRHSRTAYERLFDEITSARASIIVLSPYLTDPLLSRLRALPPSVRVRIITPARNNKPLVRRALLSTAAGSDLELLLYQPRMSHLKAVLVDDTRLILGSYNFDFVGSELQQEVVLSTADPTLIHDFQTRILQPALSHSSPIPPPPRRRPIAVAPLLLRAAETIIRKIPPP